MAPLESLSKVVPAIPGVTLGVQGETVLSWRETAARFRTTWDAVFRAVDHAVAWGLEQRSLDNIESIGVDELSWKNCRKYLTVVYQIDLGCRRLLYRGTPMSRRYQPLSPHHAVTIAAHARCMRHSPSASESLLWSQLSGSKLGVAFRRQYVVGTFIADIAAPAGRLIVEVDGGYHALRARIPPGTPS